MGKVLGGKFDKGNAENMSNDFMNWADDILSDNEKIFDESYKKLVSLIGAKLDIHVDNNGKSDNKTDGSVIIDAQLPFEACGTLLAGLVYGMCRGDMEMAQLMVSDMGTCMELIHHNTQKCQPMVTDDNFDTLGMEVLSMSMGQHMFLSDLMDKFIIESVGPADDEE